jgi:hypothetical protein
MVSPYPQYPQSAPYGPGSLAPPPPPDAIRHATGLISRGPRSRSSMGLWTA